MIKVGLHHSISSKHLRCLHLPSGEARGDGATQSAKGAARWLAHVSNNPMRIVVRIVKGRAIPAFLRV